jgi:hypothetical protein
MFPPGESDAYRTELGLPLRDGELGYDVEFAKRPPAQWWRDVHASLVSSGRAEELGMIEAVQRPGDTIFVPRGCVHLPSTRQPCARTYTRALPVPLRAHARTHTHTHTHTCACTHTHTNTNTITIQYSRHASLCLATTTIKQVAPRGSQPRLDGCHHCKPDPPRHAPECPSRHAGKVSKVCVTVGACDSQVAP